MGYYTYSVCAGATPFSCVFRRWLLYSFAAGLAYAESGSKLTGRVVDPAERAVVNATVNVRDVATLVERTAATNIEGLYEVAGLAVGTYRIQVRAHGFRLFTIESLPVDVARTIVEDVHLEVGDGSSEVVVRGHAPLIDSATTSVGHLIDSRPVQELPLNGRYFLDLALLAAGSVTPANGFSTTPMRGLGTLAINTAGNREETVNYMINGITLNDLVFSGILYQPSISTVEEFKIDTSTFSAEYGQSSGAVVNVATRSGTTQFHGELFEFLRNDALDARNFFTFTSGSPPPFKRNQFGANLGGPINARRTFFFVAYEGLRQSQNTDLNSLVLSEAERRSVTGASAKLVQFIPPPNFYDSAGTPRYVGSSHAPVQNDQWALDIAHTVNTSGRLHGYYGYNLTRTIEPSARGNTVPGFGHIQRPYRQFLSVTESHAIGPNRLNQARFGFNRISSTTEPIAKLNPSDFSIRNGITEAIGLPQISIAGGALNFGGPSVFPSGRIDTTLVFGDMISCLCGRHSLKIGGEFRRFYNDNLRLGTGTFNFPSVSAFLSGTANSFSVILGNQNSRIIQSAFGVFVQSNYKWRRNVMLELGLRYDWNLTPRERDGRFIVFDPRTVSLVRIGPDEDIYRQNNKNFQPRVGIAWDPFGDGRTFIRSAYAILVDQPMTSVVNGTAGNPPGAVPMTVTGTIQLENAIDLARAAGLAPVSVDRGFGNAYMQSWNVNLQREVAPGFAAMAGYFGSKGSRLILRRNINQPIGGVRPYSALSESSSILPGTPLGNITQAESTGNSSYNALWMTANKALSHGVQFSASYSWSKSLDYNSQSTQGIVVQDSYQLRAGRGLSDFDTRHRFVISLLYVVPFQNRVTRAWQIAVIQQSQSGNPFNVVTSNSTINGVAGTVRPDVAGPVGIPGTVDRWFETSAFVEVPRFGNAGRNIVTGPRFSNTDVSVTRDMKPAERVRVQVRAEVFNVLNHTNFAQPSNVAGTPSFGRITSTRFPTGESGSSRQVQFGMKVMF